MNPRLKRLLVPTLIVSGAILIFVIMSGLRPEPERGKNGVRVPPVQVISLKPETIVTQISGSGTVQPTQQVNLMPQVAGVVTYLAPQIQAGNRFDEGDLLLMVDSTDYVLLVHSAEAEVIRSEMALEQEKAESLLAQQEWAIYYAETPEADPNPLTVRLPQLKLAEANLAAAKARLEQAQLALRRTRILAPFTGMVKERAVSLGQYVAPGTGLATIYNTDLAEIHIPLPEKDLERLDLRPGTTPENQVQVSITGLNRTGSWPGTLARVTGDLDIHNRMFDAVIQVKEPYASNPSGPLFNGQYVDVKIPGEKLIDVFAIPREALREFDQVWLVEENHLRIKSIQILYSDETSVFTTSGLRAGTRLVTSALSTVLDGMTVKIEDI